MPIENPESKIENQPPPPAAFHAPALAAHRATAYQARLAAELDHPPLVAGLALRPLTPATFTRLAAIGSPFLANRDPAAPPPALPPPALFRAVRDYCWLHHPAYTDDGPAGAPARRGLTRRLYRALRPPLPRLNDLLRLAAALPRGRWLRRHLRPTFERQLTHAAAQVAAHVAAAFADAPPAPDDAPETGVTLAAALTLFAYRELGWPPERTLDTPLARLWSLRRAVAVAADGGRSLLDVQEARLTAAALRDLRLNSALSS